MIDARLAFSALVFAAVFAGPTAYAACNEAPDTARARGGEDAIPGILATADQALAQGQFGEACVRYRLVLGLDRRNAAARIGLGEGALGEGQYAAAQAHFQTVATWDPANPRAHQGIGLSHLLAGDFVSAEPALRQSVTLDPTLWRSWNGLGVIADTRADWTASDEAFQHAIEAAPNEPSIHNNIGLSRMQRGSPSTAIEAFDTALRLRPGMATAAENRRIALAMSGRYDAALAGVSGEDLAPALNNVAVIAARRGDRAVAERLLAAALTASPRYYELAARNRDAMTSGQ